MPVNEVREALGSWNINLRPDTPRTVLDLLDLDTYGFGHLVIAPLRVEPHAVTPTTLLGLARYTGLYRANNLTSRDEGEPVELSGAHIAALLGDEEGKGDNFGQAITITTRPFYNGTTASSYLQAVLDRGNGITAGTIDTAGTPTDTSDVKAGDSVRQLLDFACSRFGKEWRVNPTGTLDAATKATLYPTTTTPTTAFLPGEGGRDGTLVGIDADVYRLDSDLEDWNSKVAVTATVTSAFGSASITVNPYVGFAGSPLIMQRAVSSDRARSTASANNVGSTFLNKYDETRRHVRITANVYDIGAHVQPGDGIYVYDPDQDLYSTETQVYYRGRLIFPIVLRVQAVRWPVQQGMGVYLRYWTGSAFAWLDLSDYVLWEDREAELEIGDVYRTLPAARGRLNVA